MAMTAFELFGVLKLDKSDFDRGLKDADSNASSFASKLGSGLSSAVGVGVKAIGAASAAVSAFVGSSVQAATSYESAFTGVRKTVDATEEEFAQLSDWIMEASTKMASSKEEIAATMEIAGQLGVEGVDGLEKFTETMIMLGDTTNLNAEEAASMLARFGNIAGLEAKDMDKLGSVIVDLGNNFATTESDIVQMATRLASSGTIAGLSATDIMALSTAMSSVGINAEAGGTAMAQTIAKMEKAVANGAEDMTKSFADLQAASWEDLSGLESFARVAGMSAQEFSNAWKGEPIQAISAFINGLHQLDESDESVILTLEELGLKGVRQSNMLQALALASDMMGDAINTANTAFEENVALQNEANTRYGTTESAMKQTAEAFSNLKVKIGDELQPTFQEFLSFSQVAMKSMSEGFDEGGLTGMIGAFGDALSEGLNKVVELIPTAISLGGELLGALGQGIMDNLPAIVDAAVQIMVKLSEGLVQSLPALGTGIVTIIQSFGESFRANQDAIFKAAADLFELLVNGLVNSIPGIISFVTDLIINLATWISSPDTLTPLLEGAVSIIMALANGLVEALPRLIEAIPVVVQNLVDAIVTNLPMLVEAAIAILGALAQAIIENLPLILAAAIQIMTSLGGGIIEALPTVLKAILGVLSEIIKTLIASFPKFVENGAKLVGAIIEGIVKTFGSIVKAAIGLVDEFIKGLVDGWSKIIKAGADVVTKVREGFSQKVQDAKNWGKDLIQNFIDGIVAKWNDLVNTVSNIAGTISEYLGFSEPDKGPLSNFHTFAPDMMSLFVKGINDNKNKLENAVIDAFDFENLITAPSVNINADNEQYGNAPSSNVIINVYGAVGQDINELAEIVSEKINAATNRRKVAMGVGQ